MLPGVLAPEAVVRPAKSASGVGSLSAPGRDFLAFAPFLAAPPPCTIREMFPSCVRFVTNSPTNILIALCWAGFIDGAALGQEQSDGAHAADAADAAAETQTPVDEEVIVHGQSRAMLRFQIQQAEQAVFDRFNEINSNDEFDIHCRREQLTGSHIPRRVCQANFWRDAQATAGEETARGLQGGASFDAQQFLGEATYKRRLLEKEIKRLATEDDDFMHALTRLADLKQAMQTRELPPDLSATASREATPSEGPLPYDASFKTDVRMGRKPWSHALTRRTFTIANVYGDIRSVDVECRGRKEHLQYESGAEWTLPDDWQGCDLLVEAPVGTTFSLYQFE
jgi:hypothetical protein